MRSVPPGNEAGKQPHEREPRVPPRSREIERWVRVRAVFMAALEHPESMRPAFVAEACADDPGLRDEVNSLLESERAAASFGETPVLEVLGAATRSNPPPPPRVKPGTRLGAYEVTGFLSAGGMGVVYRARHSVLGREVALKTLSAEVADSVAKRRLMREARHASILNHPNICTVHEVGEAGSAPFIVMELVDGRPLSEIVRESKPPLEQVLTYGTQVADALDHAHAHGIVHRDLKSANVVVAATGRPVVLDFGLAKRALPGPGALADSTVTASGVLAGTLSHMAPEVLHGGQADARSDIWSLGVLLYELTSGELPFHGRTPFETTSAILGEPPRPLGGRVPLALRLVIERCLVKDPDARYQGAAEVRNALDAIRRHRAWPLVGRLLVSTRRRTLYATVTAAALAVPLMIGVDRLRDQFGVVFGTRISTLALLPLENATGDPDADYYADGLTDALIDQLGAVADVRIISRGSAARVAQTAPTRVDVARQLSVDAIIEGRLRKASDRIAVDMRLIGSAGGRVLWSDTYERSAGQVLALQADLVRALTVEVRLRRRPEASERLAPVRAVNPEAYEAYLKGRYEWNKRTVESLQLAVEHFTRSIELDPTYAPAHAALADCYNQFGTMMVGTGSPLEFRPRAAAAAIRALQIDPYSAEARAALGFVRHYDWQWAEAEQEFRRAIELNPSHALTRIWYANLLMSRGRLDEALEQVYAARDLDPFSLVVNTNVGWVLNVSRRYDDAITQLTQTLALDSTYAHARWRLVDALMGAGRYKEAYAQAQRVVALENRASPALGLLARASVELGRTDEARALLAELLDRAREEYVPPPAIADPFIRLGDIENALIWISRAFGERSNYIVYMALDSAAGPLQRDPRFQALVARSGLR